MCIHSLSKVRFLSSLLSLIVAPKLFRMTWRIKGLVGLGTQSAIHKTVEFIPGIIGSFNVLSGKPLTLSVVLPHSQHVVLNDNSSTRLKLSQWVIAWIKMVQSRLVEDFHCSQLGVHCVFITMYDQLPLDILIISWCISVVFHFFVCLFVLWWWWWWWG